MTCPEELLRSAYPRALSTLIRLLGDLDHAQDALQLACEKALTVWMDDVPGSPVAWLVRTARNACIDSYRKERTAAYHAQDPGLRLTADNSLEEQFEIDHFRDDMLRLIFTCCHPKLTPNSQVTLTLRTIVGLSVSEIARIYLVSPATMERRITRARKMLKDEAIPYEIPSAQQLPTRLEAVCAVIYLIFNDGYSYSPESHSLRPELCRLAIRLGRLVARLFRRDTEVSGLLAMMLLHHARCPARMAKGDAFISLEEQDRSLWDQALIQEGSAIIDRALRRKELGPYQIQAAISAVHCASTSYEETDWEQIVVLYDVLLRYQPRAVVRLNRAMAVLQAQGVDSGIAALRELEGVKELQVYHLYHSAVGHMLAKAGKIRGAVQAYQRALELASSAVEQRLLREKIKTLENSN